MPHTHHDIPLFPRINIPETFGRAMSYEGQIHAICHWLGDYAESMNGIIEDIKELYPWKLADPFTWSVDADYKPGTFVYHDGRIWLALKDVPAGTPVEDGEYWQSILDWDTMRDEIIAQIPDLSALMDMIQTEESNRISAVAAERAERIAADNAERTERVAAVNAEKAAREAAIDEEIGNRIDAVTDEMTARIAADDALGARIDAIAPKGIIGKTRPAFYISTTGSDSNAGTDAAPWKTFDHALHWPQEHGYNDWSIYIIGSGTYTCTDPIIAGISLHILARADNVTINFSESFSAYQVYLHFEATANGSSRYSNFVCQFSDGFHSDYGGVYSYYTKFYAASEKNFDCAGTPGIFRYTEFQNINVMPRDANFYFDTVTFRNARVTADHADVHTKAITVYTDGTKTFWKQSGFDYMHNGVIDVHMTGTPASGAYLFDFVCVDAKIIVAASDLTFAGTKYENTVNLNGTSMHTRAAFITWLKSMSTDWFPFVARESDIVCGGYVETVNSGFFTPSSKFQVDEIRYDVMDLDHVVFLINGRVTDLTHETDSDYVNLGTFDSRFAPKIVHYIDNAPTDGKTMNITIMPTSGIMRYYDDGSWNLNQIKYLRGNWFI